MLVVVMVLSLAVPRRTKGEEFADFKMLQYQEGDGRVRVLAPTFMIQKELGSRVTLKIDGIYNSITGATPTGAPMQYSGGAAFVTAPTPAFTGGGQITRSPAIEQTAPEVRMDQPVNDGGGEDDEDEVEIEGRSRARVSKALSKASGSTAAVPARKVGLTKWNSLSGATVKAPAPAPTAAPAPAPAPVPVKTPTTVVSSPVSPSPVPAQVTPTTPAISPAPAAQSTLPMAQVSDERYGINLELTGHFDRHTPSVQVSYSRENDYDSIGLSMKDAVDFNQKNTTLIGGVAYTLDTISPLGSDISESKSTFDGVVGITQVLDRRTLLAINLTLGRVDGYLSDPYKVVELNGDLALEKRPESKDKRIVHVALTRYIDMLDAGVEASYRYYSDSFGISGHTAELLWHQKVVPGLILRPLLRYYRQSAADFYAVRFSGEPEFYSSDYRLSEFESLGYGLKVIWFPSDDLSLDVSFERYNQRGMDGETPDQVYPHANVVIVGARLMF